MTAEPVPSDVPAPAAASTPTTRPKRAPSKRKAADSTDDAPIQPAKRAKRSSARSNEVVQAEVTAEQGPSAQDATPDDAATMVEAETEEASIVKPKPQVKPRAKRKAAANAATIESVEAGTEDAQAESAPTAKPKRKPAVRKKPAVAKSAVRAVSKTPALGQEIEEPEIPTPAPRTRRQAAPKPAEEDSAATEAVDGELADPIPAPRKRRARQTAPPTNAPKKRRSQTKRTTPDSDAAIVSGTESDPEHHEIDPNTVSMFEITNDSVNGKTSEREKKMAEIDWAEVSRKRNEEAERIFTGAAAEEPPPPDDGTPAPIPEGVVASTEDVGDTTTTPRASATPAPPATTIATTGGIGFHLVNGVITEIESTLTLARPASPSPSTLTMTAVEEENDLTVRLNRTTWVNARRRDPTDRVPTWKSKSDPWTNEETEKFYSALKMFGTDFFIISKMFVGKTRKMIKLKFVREERLDPNRINDTLLGKSTTSSSSTTTMDLETYARETGQEVEVFTKYESLAEAEAAIKEGLKEKEEAMETALAEQRENERQRGVLEGQKKKIREAVERKREMRRGMKGGGGGGTLGGAVGE